MTRTGGKKKKNFYNLTSPKHQCSLSSVEKFVFSLNDLLSRLKSLRDRPTSWSEPLIHRCLCVRMTSCQGYFSVDNSGDLCLPWHRDDEMVTVTTETGVYIEGDWDLRRGRLGAISTGTGAYIDGNWGLHRKRFGSISPTGERSHLWRSNTEEEQWPRMNFRLDLQDYPSKQWTRMEQRQIYSRLQVFDPLKVYTFPYG